MFIVYTMPDTDMMFSAAAVAVDSKFCDCIFDCIDFGVDLR